MFKQKHRHDRRATEPTEGFPWALGVVGPVRYSPHALRRSAVWLVRSQVKAAPFRPKWPS